MKTKQVNHVGNRNGIYYGAGKGYTILEQDRHMLAHYSEYFGRHLAKTSHFSNNSARYMVEKQYEGKLMDSEDSD